MSYRLEIGLALLLATALGIAVWAGNRSEKPPPQDSRHSTFLASPDGSKGLHEVLVRLGRPVERLRAPLTSLVDSGARRAPPALLVVLDPIRPLDDDEIEAVVQFVQRGGAVLAAGRGGGMLRCAGWRLEPESLLADSLDVRQPVAGQRLNLPPTSRVLAPRRRRVEKSGGLDRLVKRQRGEEEPCDELEASGRGQRRDTLLAAVTGRPVVMRLHYAGGGSVTLAADVGWFTNRLWRDTDVPLVATAWLTPPAPARGRVAWDEFHQGFGRRGGPSLTGVTWDWLRHTPMGWAILQLVAVALVWLGVTAVRFGPARAVVERRRRSPLEHLEALAAGLESAAGSSSAVRRIVAGLRRRLSRTGGGGSLRGDDLEAWLESLELAMRGPRGREAARRLRRLIQPRGGDVLATAQAVEDVWEELRPRTTRDAF